MTAMLSDQQHMFEIQQRTWLQKEKQLQDSVADALSQKSLLLSKIGELEHQLTQHAADNAQKSALESQQREWQKRIAEQQQAFDSQQREWQQRKQQLQEQIHQITVQNNTFQSQMASKDERIAQQQHALEIAQSNLSSKDNDLEKVQRRYDELNRKYQELSSSSHQRTSMLERQLAEMCQQEISSTADTQQLMQTLQQKLRVEEQGNKSMRAQLEDARKQMTALTSDNLRLQREHIRVQSVADDARARIKELEKQLAETKPQSEKVKVLVVVVREGATPGKFDICLEESGLKGISTALQDRIKDAVARKLRERQANTGLPL